MLSHLWKLAEVILPKSSETESSEFYVDVEEEYQIVSKETLFCKNNVCVHTSTENGRHIPGYMCIERQVLNIGQRRIILSWTPNALFEKSGNRETETELEGKCYQPPQNFDDSLTIRSAIFKVDLTSMKNVKLFFAPDDKSCGQLVIGNQECHYKVFHFHHGGLNHLVDIFDNWENCSPEEASECLDERKKTFIINSGILVCVDAHPEEGRYKAISQEKWNTFVDKEGKIEDVANLRKEIFFGGLKQEIRSEAWKFLLCYFPFNSTFDERKVMKIEKEQKYWEIDSQRNAMSVDEKEIFWKNIQCTVEKDVVRTDRSNPFYAGQDNHNLQIMKNILLNYAYYHPEYGYNQGMSDLLSPILVSVQDQTDAFWCFVGLMEASVFVTSPKDEVIERHLLYLRELLHLLNPRFYIHVLLKDDAMDMLFCHRWLLLCFKREFPEQEALLMWEACWSRYQTEYFHIFICVAMIEEYGNVVIDKNMRVDGMLQYFANLSMQMDGELVLRIARKMLYKFRKLAGIPCSLRHLLSGPGIWDSAPLPDIECKCKGECMNLIPTGHVDEQRPKILETSGHSSFEIISDKEFESVRISAAEETNECAHESELEEISPTKDMKSENTSPEASPGVYDSTHIEPVLGLSQCDTPSDLDKELFSLTEDFMEVNTISNSTASTGVYVTTCIEPSKGAGSIQSTIDTTQSSSTDQVQSNGMKPLELSDSMDSWFDARTAQDVINQELEVNDINFDPREGEDPMSSPVEKEPNEVLSAAESQDAQTHSQSAASTEDEKHHQSTDHEYVTTGNPSTFPTDFQPVCTLMSTSSELLTGYVKCEVDSEIPECNIGGETTHFVNYNENVQQINPQTNSSRISIEEHSTPVPSVDCVISEVGINSSVDAGTDSTSDDEWLNAESLNGSATPSH